MPSAVPGRGSEDRGKKGAALEGAGRGVEEAGDPRISAGFASGVEGAGRGVKGAGDPRVSAGFASGV